MSIWDYRDSVGEAAEVAALVARKTCPFCETAVDEFLYRRDFTERVMFSEACAAHWAHCCPTCGWWTVHVYEDDMEGPVTFRREYGAVASLRELDVSDQTLPLEQIRSYLAAKYTARANVDAWRFEEVVASVYRDHGYDVRVTARSNDEGIDVLLDKDEKTIGVQVKRYSGAINVEQIHSLAGALIRRGLTEGIFVTTSRFQPGAERASNELRPRGIAIELVDAKRFYEALGIAQRERYRSGTDRTAPFNVNPGMVNIGRSFGRTPGVHGGSQF